VYLDTVTLARLFNEELDNELYIAGGKDGGGLINGK